MQTVCRQVSQEGAGKGGRCHLLVGTYNVPGSVLGALPARPRPHLMSFSQQPHHRLGGVTGEDQAPGGGPTPPHHTAGAGGSGLAEPGAQCRKPAWLGVC